MGWTYSPIEPYNNTVTRTDGTVDSFATMERPKFVYADPADPTKPTHLFNGVSPVWDASNRSNPCWQCGGATSHCSACKVHKGVDWTYTLAQPLAFDVDVGP